MKTPKIVYTLVTAAAITVSAGMQAHAETVEFPRVPTLTYGGLCWTTIRTWAQTNAAWPDQAILNIQALPVQGIGSGRHPLAPVCNVLTTVNWRNTTTGAHGSFQTDVVSGMYGSLQYSRFQPTGRGHIEVEVTTNNAGLPAHASFEQPFGKPPLPTPKQAAQKP